jgi:flagellar FliL protein
MISVYRTSFYYLCLLFCLVSFAHAEEELESLPKVQYYELSPSFVANFGEATAKRLKFIKADLTVSVFGDEAVSAVRAHNALIRHQVVMILSAQTDQSLAASEGQDNLRKAIVAKVKAVLKEETGKEQIDDLLFTNFVVQR